MTFLAVIAVSVWTVSAFTVPQPLENFYVADYANVINSKDADAIRTVNKNLEARNGSQIVVATFDFFWTARRSTTSPMTCLMAGRSAAPAIIMACCWSWRSAKKITIAFRVKAWKNAADFGHSGHPGFYAGTGVCGRQLQHRSIKNGSGSGAAIGKTAGTPVVNPSPSQGGGGGTPYSARPAFGLFTMIPSIFLMIFVFVLVVVILSVFTPRRRRYYGGPVFRPRPRRYYGPRPRPMDPWGPGAVRVNPGRRIVPIPQPAAPLAADRLPGLPEPDVPLAGGHESRRRWSQPRGRSRTPEIDRRRFGSRLFCL